MPHLDYYNYLGVKFTIMDIGMHIIIKDLVTAGKCKVNSLFRILHNPCLSSFVKRQVILSILRPYSTVVKCGGVQLPYIRH